MSVVLPAWLGAHEKRLEKSGHTKYIAGNSLSVADFAFIAFLTSFPYNEGSPFGKPIKEAFEKFTKLKNYAMNMKNIVAPYLE